ncbi:unnamed protein product [Rotaria sordida]|uniref:PX domain-containing protein kinase-like protein n=1 Tax=Rotaria sordida TaxID=392033 RepID=A0A819GMY2_9BILA|nr:unnamed protein product [Rotaria sordida]CAF3884553.1 unnamed protein product [Rotaria sordida]
MALLIVPQRATNIQSPVDATLPMTCIIESSYVVDGHGEYSIRVTRILNDPLSSWIITKRFREFVDLNNALKEYGFNFELPKKKFLGNTDRTFMAERQKGLQTYLNTLVQHIELCNSLLVHRFLDPENHIINYPESALQYVSMYIRSMNNRYQIIEPLFDFGWRYNKSYFLASKTGCPKNEHYLLIWCHYGLDKALGEKETMNCLKLIKSILHPLIAPIEEVYANESGTLTICPFYNRGSLKDYIHRTKPANGVYWKRYGPTSTLRQCDLHQIKILGRQILEALYFLYENNLVYGHLHSGNILFDFEQSQSIKLLDITNVITGVSSKYRRHYSNLKYIHTFEQCDIYAFGRLLYELSTGEECPLTLYTEFPSIIPFPVQEILSKIFISSGNLPTIEQLLNEPFFQVTLSSVFERFQLKLNNKAKEAFEQINRIAQERLENDQIKIKFAQRHLKISNHLMSDEEKLRRRRERQAKALEKKMENSLNTTDTSKSLQYSITVDPLQTTTTTTTTNTETTISNKLVSPNISVNIPNIPETSPSPQPTVVNDARTQLLNSILDFNLSKLKQAKTNDHSVPKFK